MSDTSRKSEEITGDDVVRVAQKHGAVIRELPGRGVVVVDIDGLTLLVPIDDRCEYRDGPLVQAAFEQLAYVLMWREVEAVRQSTPPADSTAEKASEK